MELFDPSTMPSWGWYLVLAGWLIDRCLAFLKWRLEEGGRKGLGRIAEIVDDVEHQIEVVVDSSKEAAQRSETIDRELHRLRVDMLAGFGHLTRDVTVMREAIAVMRDRTEEQS